MYGALATGQIRRQFSSYDVSWLSHLYGSASNPGTTNGDVVSSDAAYADGFAPEDGDAAAGGNIGATMIGYGAGIQHLIVSPTFPAADMPGQQPAQSSPA